MYKNYKRKATKKMPKKVYVEKASKLMSRDFEPRTENQKNYIITMAENDITICNGVYGSGKTYLSVGLACQYLISNKVDKLIFTRPIVGCGKGLGFLKGSLDDKIMPYFFPVLDCLDYFLGKEVVRGYIMSKDIEFIPLELMRGMSMKNTFLILDESNNANIDQLKMLLTRLDYGSKFVLNGDYRQTDLKYCYFKDVIEKLRLKNIKGLGICELTKEDIQRPKIIDSIFCAIEEE